MMDDIVEKKLSDAFKSIKIGHKNTINAPEGLEKEFSDFVDQKNLKGDVIINVGNGYYRPYPFDKTDSKEFEQYITSEFERANDIIEKCTSMNMTYEIITEKIQEKWKEIDNVG